MRFGFAPTLASLIIAVASAPPAAAQSDTQTDSASTSDSAQDSDKPAVPDFGKLVTPATEAPGFEALGKSGSDISYPASIQKVAAAILNGLDQNGDFNTGLAIQFSPYLVTTHNLSSRQYLRDQALARFSLTAATAKAAESEKGLSASLGFVWTPIAGDDPYGDATLMKCVTDILDANAAGTPPPDDADDGTVQPIASPHDDEFQGCETAFQNKAKWNVQLGGAAIFFSPTGKTNDLVSKGFYVTGTARYTLPVQNFSLVAAASYRDKEPVPDPATKGAFLQRSRLTLGGRIVFGDARTSIFGLEAAYQHADYGSRGRDNYITYVGAFSFKLSEDLWATVKAGGSSGHRIDGNPGFFGTSLTWGSKPEIEAPTASVKAAEQHR